MPIYRKKEALRALLIVATALGCSAATFSGTLAALASGPNFPTQLDAA